MRPVSLKIGIMVLVFLGAAALSLLLFLLGIGLALKDRGHRSTRRGAEIYNELARAARDRDSFYESDVTLGHASKAWGDGVEIRGEAKYSWPELIGAWRERRWRFLAPALLGTAGGMGMLVFAGCALLSTADPGTRAFGFLFLLFAVFIVSRVRKLIRTAVSEAAAGQGIDE